MADWVPREQPAFPLVGAIGITLLFHLLLFTSIEISNPAEKISYYKTLLPPATAYNQTTIAATTAEADIRNLWSPILFALPTKLGFSHNLYKQDFRIQPAISQQIKTERFLKIDSPIRTTDDKTDFKPLLQLRKLPGDPTLPSTAEPTAQAESRRVYISPALETRKAEEITLPPELNKGSTTPWQVQAEVNISPAGSVSHVLIKEPVKPAELHNSVLKLLYGLRFAPANNSSEGVIEIYSTKETTGGEAE